MKEYLLLSVNLQKNGWTSTLDSLHDAEVAIEAITFANSLLKEELQFHGFVTCITYHLNKCCEKVIDSKEVIKELNF